jgi:hypothetical protein
MLIENTKEEPNMKAYRWEWPKENFFIEVSCSSREEAIQIAQKFFPEISLSSAFHFERDRKASYINWGRMFEEEAEEDKGVFHHCHKCDFSYKVLGRVVDGDKEGIIKTTTFDQPCPLCHSRGTGTILKFVEDCPVCQYAWGIDVFRELSGGLYFSAECECCGNRMSERTAMDDTDRLIDKWEFITTHIMIERAEEY